MEITKHGNVRWYNAYRELHRGNDLPAIEDADGRKEWYINGLRHRDNDLPAIECANGDKLWYENGKSHRLGGLSACKYTNGDKSSCWIYGEYYTYSDICNYYKILKRFGRYCLRKIRMRKVRWIHGELLCMPSKGNYPGGQDYHQTVSYFMSLKN
jgi:hypothetical protein